jgi:hypothetical protein
VRDGATEGGVGVLHGELGLDFGGGGIGEEGEGPCVYDLRGV